MVAIGGIVAIGVIEVIKMIFVVRDFRYSSFICNFAKKLRFVSKHYTLYTKH